MADNTTIKVAKDGDRAFHKCLRKIKTNEPNGIKRKMWYCSGAPTVDAGSQDDYPIALGDWIYDYTNANPYICTVAPTAAVAGTFVKIVP